jgi:hypothetical protein
LSVQSESFGKLVVPELARDRVGAPRQDLRQVEVAGAVERGEQPQRRQRAAHRRDLGMEVEVVASRRDEQHLRRRELEQVSELGLPPGVRQRDEGRADPAAGEVYDRELDDVRALHGDADAAFNSFVEEEPREAVALGG